MIMTKEDKDFRVGDAVCHHMYGDDVIVEVVPSGYYRIGTEGGHSIMACGRNSAGDAHPAWFHGTWGQVFGNAKDVRPVRTVERFVNIWIRPSGDLECSDPEHLHRTTEAATKASRSRKSKCDYIATAVPVQIPEDMV
jgi:hypothetical protein